ncbi:uncharacterized protein CIMG_08400 [Coccidioides immitis RS]|uniref:Phytanoyl-CoA dioxygenase n=1 Tax=Coccidioides immitis (strain RS) TaxID=246410 RepID=J3K5F5_COCIM|nr:uncharacterized protein CIMG_08400 [Coccidioides immitis RS]EAS29654.3 hypothetical protein CIMG_08400 [Coccidioides immitis RS]
MANALGFEIVEAVVSSALANEAADALLKQTQHRREKYDAYNVPNECLLIVNKFLESPGTSALAEFLKLTALPLRPTNVFAGMFRETNADPNKLKTAEEGEVYITIALTDLSPKNGWYTFYPGSRKTQPLTSMEPVALDLKAGDAVIWRGDLVYFHTPGGGGMFLTLVYNKCAAT